MSPPGNHGNCISYTKQWQAKTPTPRMVGKPGSASEAAVTCLVPQIIYFSVGENLFVQIQQELSSVVQGDFN